jgi:hypothetical protein
MKSPPFKKRLEALVIKQHPPDEIGFFKMLFLARRHVLRGIKQAQDALAGVGYHLAIVTETGSMVSAKLFPPSINRDFAKSPGELIMEEGFPLNFQITVTDQGMIIYSKRYGVQSQAAPIVASKNTKTVQDAIMTELEKQIALGVQFFMEKR